MKRWLAACLVALAALATGCASLPPPQDRIASAALTDTADTPLGRAVTPLVAGQPGRTGVLGLTLAHDAFAVRVALASVAQKSLDAQYFIWHDDQVGVLMFEALWQAAERGVRVRVLLDDANTSGLDPLLAALEAHPNIDLRLYNPFPLRGSRFLGYVSEFGRLNKRMHNKSFTVDNQVTVVGGRNIANEYFGAGSGIGFADIDVLAIGTAVREVSTEFDLYWNSASAYPAAGFVGTAAPDAPAMLKTRFAQTRAHPVSIEYLKAVNDTPIVAALRRQELALEWTTAQVLYDHPAKTLDSGERTDVLLLPALMRRLGQPRESLDIVSPYFVPGDDGTRQLAELARQGVKVRVLTNSLAASDERVVHSGYMKRRLVLLQAGVSLYELKPSANKQSLHTKGRFGSGKVAGLHAKTYAVDGSRIFIGSFNFDPRSAQLNTEMGMVIDSASGAATLSRFLDRDAAELAYEVRLDPDGQSLHWIERSASGEEKRYDVDPETDWSQRFIIDLLSGLPIDWLL